RTADFAGGAAVCAKVPMLTVRIATARKPASVGGYRNTLDGECSNFPALYPTRLRSSGVMNLRRMRLERERRRRGQAPSINPLTHLRTLNLSALHRKRIRRPSIASPRSQIKMPTHLYAEDADVPKCQRHTFFANFWCLRRTQKIRALALPHYCRLSLRLHQHRRLLVDCHFPR